MLQHGRAIKAALLVICLTYSGCVTFREKPKVISSYFAAHDVSGSIETYQSGHRKMHYAQTGQTGKPVVVFVHGSPGSLSSFVPFLVDSSLLAKAQLISMDRPGFGYSRYGQGEKSLAVQAAVIRDLLLDKKGDQPLILVGHSLGGPLVARVAMDYPDLIDGLVLVAGSIDPELEPNETWFRAPLATPFLRWILPGSLRASNYELYHLKPELEVMIPSWKDLRCPVVIIHGERDNLVPFGNVAFAKKHLDPLYTKYITHEAAGHFIPWEQPEMISEGVLYLLDKLKDAKSPGPVQMTTAMDSTGLEETLR
jgi:pimeloyl-ACP methyl ester carboxylesterase